MNLTGNTIFITGGGSGIGRGIAEALHAKGNQIIISGRRKSLLEEVVKANPGMAFVELDITDAQNISKVAHHLIATYPDLNVVINNAGIMKVDDVQNPIDEQILISTVATNLLGPIRLTSALVEHLKRQPSAHIVHVTSGVAFVPLSVTAVYSATKAAMHSFSLSQRYLLRDTSVKVLELIPPYVQTELMSKDQVSDSRAMALKDFIDQTLNVLSSETPEVLTEGAMGLRSMAGVNDIANVATVNDWFLSGETHH